MKENRHVQILELLSREDRIKVNSLAEFLGISTVTIRKDLDTLEKQGLVLRKHGYACINNHDNVVKRMPFNYDIKRRIAIAAAATIEAGETVMIESGSCCALFADELARSQKDITIVTNSVYIANFIHNASHTKIILLAGFYQPALQIVLGPMTRKSAENFFSDKFFVGTNGFIPGFGFTGKDHLRSQTVTDIAELTRRTFILTESEKFSHQGVQGVIKLENVTGVFTDTHIPAEFEKQLLDNKIALYKVEPFEKLDPL